MIRKDVMSLEKGFERTHCKQEKGSKKVDILGLLNLPLKLFYTKKDIFLIVSCSSLLCLVYSRHSTEKKRIPCFTPASWQSVHLECFSALDSRCSAMHWTYWGWFHAPKLFQHWFPWQIYANTENKVSLRKRWRGWG